MRDRVGQRADHPEHLDDGAGPPCVMISGNASGCGDCTWMKWMSTPSISVLYCGSAFSFDSHARQS